MKSDNVINFYGTHGEFDIPNQAHILWRNKEAYMKQDEVINYKQQEKQSRRERMSKKRKDYHACDSCGKMIKSKGRYCKECRK